jgi:hypothetical protein
VTCVGKGGTLDAAYWEGDVYAEAAPAIWDSSTQMVQDIGPGSLPACVTETAGPGTLPDGSAADPDKLKYGAQFTHCTPPAGTTAKVWGSLSHTSHGIVLTRYDDYQGMITVSCSLRNAKYYDLAKAKYFSDGIVSSCAFPDGTNLTFAPWGVVGGSS